MRNVEIKQRAKEKGVKLWQLAERLGITDSTFSRRLRREFSEEEYARVCTLIDELAAGGGQ